MLLHQQSISLLYLLNKKKRETVTEKKNIEENPFFIRLENERKKKKDTTPSTQCCRSVKNHRRSLHHSGSHRRPRCPGGSRKIRNRRITICPRHASGFWNWVMINGVRFATGASLSRFSLSGWFGGGNEIRPGMVDEPVNGCTAGAETQFTSEAVNGSATHGRDHDVGLFGR
jgi:hypothetical protein